MLLHNLSLGLFAALTLAACAGAPAPKDEAASTEAVAARKAAAPEPVVGEDKLIAAVDVENSVFFPSSGTAVDADGRRRLLEHAARLKANPDLVVTLVGHTDNLGSPSYNLAIAEQRVNAVYAVLRSQGVPLIQIRRYGVGSEQMGLGCKSAQCRRQMRRVQLHYGE